MHFTNAPCAEYEPVDTGTGMPDCLLAADIGNTNIVLGLFVDSQLRQSLRLNSDSSRSADEYYSLLAPLLQQQGFSNPSQVVIASVVPELTRIWQHLSHRHFDVQPLIVNAMSPLGLKYKVEDPSFIGSDMVINAFATWQKYQSSAIIIDLGTATTVQFVTSAGVFEGSAIIPGLKTGARNLFAKAAQLSEIEIIRPPALIGKNTRDALLSGIVHSHAFSLEKYIYQLKLQYFDQKPIICVMTGGMADLLKPLVPSVDYVDKNLTLEGLLMARNLLAGISQTEQA